MKTLNDKKFVRKTAPLFARRRPHSRSSRKDEFFSAREERERERRVVVVVEREREKNHGFVPENRAGDAFVRAKGTNRARENIREGGCFLARARLISSCAEDKFFFSSGTRGEEKGGART